MKAMMIDITEKEKSKRIAIAEGIIKLRPETIELIKNGKIEKGDVIAASVISGIMSVKKTIEIIPLAHNIPIEAVEVEHQFLRDGIKVIITVRTTAKTGVEMEALTGVMAALLTIWDMVKKYEKDEEGQYPHTKIENVRVIMKKKEEIKK